MCSKRNKKQLWGTNEATIVTHNFLVTKSWGKLLEKCKQNANLYVSATLFGRLGRRSREGSPGPGAPSAPVVLPFAPLIATRNTNSFSEKVSVIGSVGNEEKSACMSASQTLMCVSVQQVRTSLGVWDTFEVWQEKEEDFCIVTLTSECERRR
jgi:hypothetical protein